MRGTTDWSPLEVEGVREVANQAARRVARRYSEYVDLDDLTQDALARIVAKADLLECLEGEEPELGLLQYRLERDLVNMVTTQVKHAQQTISYDRLVEADDEGHGYVRPYVAIATASSEYTRESVETLLPAVWDESYVYGMPKRDDAPDPDMPKGSTNKAQGNNLSAYIADIKTGWEKTPLTTKERRALVLAYGFGWTQQEIAYNQGVSQQTIQERLYKAVGKIVARLNGGLFYELLGVEA